MFQTMEKQDHSPKYQGEPSPSDVGIATPSDNDVLFGRGRHTNMHPGNVTFRNLVSDHKIGYLSTKEQVSKYAELVVEHIRSKLNGRFLKQDKSTKLWHEVETRRALGKTKQALREGAPELREKMTRSAVAQSAAPSTVLATSALGDAKQRQNPDDWGVQRWPSTPSIAIEDLRPRKENNDGMPMESSSLSNFWIEDDTGILLSQARMDKESMDTASRSEPPCLVGTKATASGPTFCSKHNNASLPPGVQAKSHDDMSSSSCLIITSERLDSAKSIADTSMRDQNETYLRTTILENLELVSPSEAPKLEWPELKDRNDKGTS